MVTQRSAEYDAVQVKALLQGYLSADVWNAVNQTRSQRSGLTNTVGDNILLLSDRLRIIEIEMLVETKIHLHVLLCYDGGIPQLSDEMEGIDERLTLGKTKGRLCGKEVIRFVDVTQRVAIMEQ